MISSHSGGFVISTILTTISQQSAYIADEPRFYDESRLKGIGTELIRAEGISSDLILNVIQFHINNEKTIGPGSAKYQLTFHLEENNILQNSIRYYTGLNLQVFGEYDAAWTLFFKNQHSFIDSNLADTLFYTAEESEGSSQTFMLSFSSFNTDLEVM